MILLKHTNLFQGFRIIYVFQWDEQPQAAVSATLTSLKLIPILMPPPAHLHTRYISYVPDSLLMHSILCDEHMYIYPLPVGRQGKG